jgi:hypothetical protein
MAVGQAQKTRAPDTFSAPQVRILPPPAAYHFPNGESYVFSVEWHLFTAGTATVSLSNSGQQEHVTADAHSSGFVNALYKVNDQFEAFFDPRTFCSQRMSKHTEEGSRRRDTQVTFNYPRLKSVLEEKNLKTGDAKHEENDIPSCVTDVISGFYYLASLPLAPGNVHTFPVNDGGKTTQVEAHVEAHEQVKVPAGTFQTVRVKAEAISGPLKGKGTVWVWFTDDANRTPVQMRSKLGWGTLLFRLQRLQKQ